MRATLGRTRGEGGFTLIELLVGMIVLGIVTPMLAMLVSGLYTTSSQTINQSVQQTEVRAGLDTLVSELRSAYSGDPAVNPIVTANATTLTFYSPDRQLLFHLREITYKLAGGKFQRASVTSSDTDGAPWVGLSAPTSFRTLTTAVTNATAFSYVYSPTAPTQLTRATVTLTVKPVGYRGPSTTYTASAEIRAGAS